MNNIALDTVFYNKYILKLSANEEYYFTLSIRLNETYYVQLVRIRKKLIMYETNSGNTYRQPDVSIATCLAHDVNAVGDTVVDAILQYLSFEYVYHISNIKSTYRINSIFNVIRNEYPDQTILTFGDNDDMKMLEYCLICDSNQMVTVSLYHSIQHSNGFSVYYEYVKVDIADTVIKMCQDKSPKNKFILDPVIDKIIKHYYPVILKDTIDSNILCQPLCKIIADYCVSKPNI